MSNSNIVEHGRATRFGQPRGANPSLASETGNKPYSIRNAIRLIAARENKGGKSNAELIAQKLINMAMDGDIRAIETVINNIDGKAVQPIQEITTKFMPEEFISEEAAAAAFAEFGRL